MIKSVIRIKNFPSFIDFKPSANLPEFSKYNLVYGWNGSGKTCFSRILRSFELEQNFFDISEQQSEFEFKMDNGTYISHNNLSAFKAIRVFNKDFIEDSIFLETGAKPIFFLGKESKEDKEKIVKAEGDLKLLRGELSSKETGFNKAKENKDRILSDKARDIRAALTSPTRNDSYRNYERPNLEEVIKNNPGKIKKPESLKLTENRITAVKKSILQTSKEKITALLIPSFDISELERDIRDILLKAVVSQVIGNLKPDEVISKWVERGLEIHKEKSLNVCAFCDQKIPSNRIKDLENHFNDEYQKMLRSVQELKSVCGSRRVRVEFPESSNLYDDLAAEYLTEKKKVNNAFAEFNKILDSLVSVLEQKEQNLFSQPILEKISSVDASSLSKINEIIERHNQKTDNFESQIDKDKKDLEFHYIAEFLPSYNEALAECDSSQKDHSDLLLAVKRKEQETKTLKESLISHHIPVRQINKNLEQFLGHSEIQLRATDAEDGYQITRNGEVAKNLSEGERTALAIVYFLAKIEEDGFDLKNSVVVIDDPVSSLDSNAIFQAFSFIKESIKEAEQIFILTHHFDYFRQVKGWFNYGRNKDQSSFYMIVCSETADSRKSSLVAIDDLLIKYESEYHFLFRILYCLVENQEKDLEKLYSIPNIARKFLESFLAFRVPTIGNKGEPYIYSRLEEIDFDGRKKSRILRFVDTHSHPRYESGVQDFDMTVLGEASSVTKDLLELVRKEDKKHYDFLVKSIVS